MNYTAYPIFAALAMVSCTALNHWLRGSRLSLWTFRAICAGPIVILLGGFGGMEWAVNREEKDTSGRLMQIATTYARETERLGHEEIAPGRPLDETRYMALHEAQTVWMAANREVGDIYTLRRLPDGSVSLVVNAKPEQGVTIGSPYRGDLQPMISRALAGESVISPAPYTDRRGTWISALVPLRDSKGRVEAVLGVDFATTDWLAVDRRTRMIVVIVTALALLLHAAGALITVHFNARRVIAEQREGLSTLEIEHAVIEEIVNSIDAIVWEWDVTAHRFTFVSSQAGRILGYEVEKWLADAELWRLLLHPDDRWADRHFDQLIEGGRPYTLEYRMIARDGHTVWIRETGLICRSLGAEGSNLVRGCLCDISTEKKSELELQIALEKLVENSRRAGMAEVASGVLHNVGNVLNSVNVSGNLIMDRIKNSRVDYLFRVTELVHENRTRLSEFFASDPHGRILPELLDAVAEQLLTEHDELLREVAQINDRIGHIKDIVSVQQDHARIGGLVEPGDLVLLVEDALKLNEQSLRRARVQVIRDYDDALAPTLLDGHLVLQILVNLIRNAIDAIEVAAPAQPSIIMAVQLAALGTKLRVSVTDNGNGVAPENLQRIFGHGYTTKRHGHGFGLRSGAIAAVAMGGSLTAESAGLGHGAAFILEIPVDPTATEQPAF